MALSWSNMAGLPVKTADSPRPLGFMEDIYLNPETGQILAYQVGPDLALHPMDLQSAQADAILIKGKDSLVPFSEISRLKQFGLPHCRILKKTVLSNSGKKIGRVLDLQIDNIANMATTLIVSKKILFWKFNERIFPIEAVDHISKKAVHLNLNTEDPKTTKRARLLTAELS